MEELKEKINVCFFLDANDLSMDDLNIPTELDENDVDDTPFKENDEKVTSDDDINPDDIFKDDETQEKVGGEDDKSKEKEGPDASEDKGSSPKKSTFYSSALKALKDDGVLPDLEDEFISNTKTPEDFAEAIEKQVSARLEENQRRIKEAIENGVEVDDVKRFENAINYLNGINEDEIVAEDESGETLRKRIIYQDYINKGFKPERAEKEVTKSFNAGTDIEDAQTALESNKEFFKEEYEELINQKKQETLRLKTARDKEVKEFQKKVLETESPFGIKVDKTVRQKILDNIVKPVHKENGKLLTAIQKYQSDNPSDYEYYTSLFYTMTDGFKNIDKFIGQKVKQEKKSALKEMEHALRNTPLNGDGSIDFSFGENDENSFFGTKGLKINI